MKGDEQTNQHEHDYEEKEDKPHIGALRPSKAPSDNCLRATVDCLGASVSDYDLRTRLGRRAHLIQPVARDAVCLLSVVVMLVLDA